jgi:hypothetical protein
MSATCRPQKDQQRILCYVSYHDELQPSPLIRSRVSMTRSSRGAPIGHRSASRLYDQIANVNIEKFSTREAAITAEKAAIKMERPRYNIKQRMTVPIPAKIRHKVEPRDVPASKAARRLHLTLEEFRAKLPDLAKRGFPLPDPTTGMFFLPAIDKWMEDRHGLTSNREPRDDSEIDRRLARAWGG